MATWPAVATGAVVASHLALTSPAVVGSLGWRLNASAGPLANVAVPGLVLLGVGATAAPGERWSRQVAVEARRRSARLPVLPGPSAL